MTEQQTQELRFPVKIDEWIGVEVYPPNIPHFYHHIDGWFTFQNLYRQIADWIPDGGTWVEVGVYSGKSFSFGIVECLNRGKNVEFVAVDMFPREWINPGENRPPVFQMFQSAMKPLEGHFKVAIGKSTDVARQFADESIDFVFIDAAHDYDNVRADLIAWTGKVRPGGIIAGHDYENDYQGLMQAVNEIFGDRVELVPYDEDETKHCWRVQL